MEDRFGADSVWEIGRQSIFPRGAFDAAPAEMAACLKLAGVTGAVDLLDLPCGPGRHSLPMARVGHRVVAVDRTPAYLKELRARAADDELKIDVVEADMREFVRPASFDLILNLYHSFGYFEDVEDDRRVLRNFATSLRPGGALLMDLIGREIMTRDFEPLRQRELPDGTVVREEAMLSDDGRWLYSTWLFTTDGETREFDMSHRLYGGDELRAELRLAGFDEVALHGGLDGRPWSPEAIRLVAVARVAPC